MTDMDRDLGRLEARMETLEGELHAIRADVREIRDALVKAKGGWLWLTAALSLAATAGGWLSTHVSAFLKFPN